MAEAKKYLQDAYSLETKEQTTEFYRQWAASYESEVTGNGYITPERCAKALASQVEDLDAPVLDLGCGTGLSGIALRAAGFGTIDGCDLSAEMLQQAKAHPELYRRIWQCDVTQPFDFEAGTYQHIAATGLIAVGHAPPETIDLALSALPKGGCLVFSLNDHTLADQRYETRLMENLDTGNAIMLLREHGPHLPGLDMSANVYVLQKL